MDEIEDEILRCGTLPDEDLWKNVHLLSKQERTLLAEFLIHLAELDRRDVCTRYGFSSVFAYLTRGLGHSEFEAIMRIKAARAASRFPSIYRMPRASELHMTAIAMLEPFLTSENHRKLLGQARGRRKHELEQLIARLRPPSPEPCDRIRALPPAKAPRSALIPGDEPSLGLLPGRTCTAGPGPLAFGTESSASAQQSSPPMPASEDEEGVEDGRKLFTFAGSVKVHELFLQARDLLRHKFPEGRMEDIIGEALRRLVKAEMPACRKRRVPKTRAAGDTPASPRPGASLAAISASSSRLARRVPRWVQAAVWRRDEGACSYIGPTGIRCGETAWLEFDHIVPWALGGRSDDPSNIRLLCRAHNQAEARRLFPPTRSPRPARRRPEGPNLEPEALPLNPLFSGL